ncbi:hypothetical protein CTAYLR_003633 [Chrysophaeum taylorii]|uniref:Uncharacterized protein n=1 Tax=Chrysophaeum taylorii TaxID=2483200 RepID=A0AAD7UEP5_9STRA|nr:hypothetical protein CTAYLR_003633 [Chrysophaeum taylorii]
MRIALLQSQLSRGRLHHSHYSRGGYAGVVGVGSSPTRLSAGLLPDSFDEQFQSFVEGLSGGTYSGSAFTVVQQEALIVGYLMLLAAVSPYVLGLFFPQTLNEQFFLPIYKDDAVGRTAEIYWKLMYATLGILLTTLAVVEVFTTNVSAAQLLRDTYLLWATFYTAATVKIRVEATRLNIIDVNRFGIQLWHSLVVLVMWASVYFSYAAYS